MTLQELKESLSFQMEILSIQSVELINTDSDHILVKTKTTCLNKMSTLTNMIMVNKFIAHVVSVESHYCEIAIFPVS